MKAHKLPKLTVTEYLQQEKESGAKYEYHDGAIYALAGGTLNHGKLCGNIYAELRSKLSAQGAACKAYTGEIKICIEKKNTYVYPDSMAVCGDLKTSPKDENSVTNPTLIVEVLSKSTADYDRGDKFFIYRQIPSLQEYVLIEQDKPVVEIYYKKQNADLWRITRHEGLDTTIALQSLGIEISMKELYFDIEMGDAARQGP